VTRRTQGILVAIAVLLVVSGASWFAFATFAKPKLVTVKTGEMIVCTSGEVVKDMTREIQVPVADASKYSVKKTTITCDKHQRADKLWDEAQKALAAGDTKTAADKLKELISIQPDNAEATKQLAEIAAGKKPKPSTKGGSGASGTATATADPSPGESTAGAGGLTQYVPDAISGFTAQPVVVDPASVARNYVPTSGGSDLLVITAEQTVDAKSAAAAVKTLKATYPSSAAEVNVKSGTTGYFGTRGQLAAIVFTVGPVVVVAEMHSTGDKASELKSRLVEVAKAVAR
jgi:hypothetical protein